VPNRRRGPSMASLPMYRIPATTTPRDILRWRLRQKQASLGNAQDTVTLLKTNVLQLEQKLDRKTSEWRDSIAEVSCLYVIC
jgi:hypothetical protein